MLRKKHIKAMADQTGMAWLETKDGKYRASANKLEGDGGPYSFHIRENAPYRVIESYETYDFDRIIKSMRAVAPLRKWDYCA